MFIAALFTLFEAIEAIEPTRCLTNEEWIKKMCVCMYTHICLHTFVCVCVCFSGVLFNYNKNEASWFDSKWMQLDDIMLSEVS
jgi:hypothetical protein